MTQEIPTLRGDRPIILCSGFFKVVGADATMTAGFREFMVEPIRPDSLDRAVRRALDGDAQ